MSDRPPLEYSDLKQVAKDHHMKARERAMDPLDVFLIAPHQNAINKTVGVPSSKVGTIISHIVTPGGGRPKSSGEEAQRVFMAQAGSTRVPCFSTATCDQTNSLPGGAPLLDHLAAAIEDRPDWNKTLGPMIEGMQGWRIPQECKTMELTLGVSTDDEWQKACDNLVAQIARDRENGVFIQAADIECYGVDASEGATDGIEFSCMNQIGFHRLAGVKRVKFSAIRYGKSGSSLPVRFFVGGSDWQIHVRLPIRYGVDGDPTKISLKLNTKISRKVYQFFSALPVLVGFGITEDFVLWSQITERIWSEDFFTSVPPPIEIVDLMRLTGINMSQSSMFMANWWCLGSILPKDKASLGDNSWGKPLAEIATPLRRYLACDTAQPTAIAWLLASIWTVHHFPDMCWVTEVTNLDAQELLEWVSTHVIKGLVAGWRKLERGGMGAWTGHSTIPNLQSPETILSMPSLIKKAGVPAGSKWDILRQDPGWPAITAGGPKYIHSVRVFMNQMLPLLRSLDENTWPLPHADQPVLWQFGIPSEEVGPYPTGQPPLSAAVWEPNPGVVNPIPEDFSALTRDLIRPYCSPVRGMRAVLLEYIRLYPYSGKDLVQYMEEHPGHFKNIVGVKRFRLVITEMRDMLTRLDLEPVRKEGWTDPFRAHVRVENVKQRAAGHLKRKIEEMEKSDLQLTRNIALAKSALEDALDPEVTAVGGHALFRRWNEPAGICHPPGCSRAIKAAGGAAVVPPEPQALVTSEVEEPPTRRQKVRQGPAHFHEDLELFINQSEMEEFGPN